MAGKLGPASARRQAAEIPPEIDAHPSDVARRLGISVKALLERCVTGRAVLNHAAQPRPALPVWHLEGAGRLHRRDLDDDAR
jgi:hypothetical protein